MYKRVIVINKNVSTVILTVMFASTLKVHCLFSISVCMEMSAVHKVQRINRDQVSQNVYDALVKDWNNNSCNYVCLNLPTDHSIS